MPTTSPQLEKEEQQRWMNFQCSEKHWDKSGGLIPSDVKSFIAESIMLAVEKEREKHLQDLKILWTATLGQELNFKKPPKFRTLSEIREMIQNMQLALSPERSHD